MVSTTATWAFLTGVFLTMGAMGAATPEVSGGRSAVPGPGDVAPTLPVAASGLPVESGRTGAAGVPQPVPLDAALFAAIVEHVRDEHLQGRSFLVWTADGLDASRLTEQARTLGAVGLVEKRSGTGTRCEAESRRCRVDGAESIVRINTVEAETGITTVQIFVGRSIDGAGGPSVRGGARRLTLERRGEAWEVTDDTLLFKT